VISNVLSGMLVVLGAAIVVRTLAAGTGGGLGLLIGSLFVVVGAARLYLQTRLNRG
jgi:hypothetical protein